jgi:SRSO17 transposase
VTTHDDPAVAAELSVDLLRWREQFDELMGRIAGRFARVEPRRRARAFVLGLLSGLRRKNCWTIAEQAGDGTPDGMQHLLAGARWDADAVRDDVRGYVVDHLGSPDAVLVVDETGDVMKGRAAVILSFSVDRGCDLGFRVADDDLDVAVAALRGVRLRA